MLLSRLIFWPYFLDSHLLAWSRSTFENSALDVLSASITLVFAATGASDGKPTGQYAWQNAPGTDEQAAGLLSIQTSQTRYHLRAVSAYVRLSSRKTRVREHALLTFGLPKIVLS